MIKSRKCQLGIVLLLTCICAPLLGADPNDATIELEFEISSDRPPKSLMRMSLQPPYDSTHCAFLFIRGGWDSQPIKDEDPVLAILSTNAARTMSPTQREFVSTLPFKSIDFGNTIGNHTYFRLYGVGEYDTQKMAKAFIEALANKADKEVQHFLSRKQKYQKEIDKIQKELPEKQKQYEEAKAKYNEIKNTRYFADNPNETYRKAMETVFQMDKTLDTLEIELAGIREKMKAIEQFRRGQEPVRNQTNQVNYRLDEMFVEQMVELRGVEARKKAALKIREREKEFLDIFNQWGNLESEVDKLKNSLRMSENNLRSVEKILDNPVPEMLPPKVFQNKVTIYPVK